MAGDLIRRHPPRYNSLVCEIPKYGPSNVTGMNDAFQALGDPTRREILRMLRQREMTAGEIADQFKLAKSTLSGHFNVLKHAGLIVAEKTGTTIVYSLNLSIVEETVATLMELFDVGAAKKQSGAKPKPAATPRDPRERKLP